MAARPPPVLLLAGLASGQPHLALAGGGGVAVNLALRLLLCARFKQSLAGALLHPFGACLVLAIQWHALLRHLLGWPNRWRGRFYVDSVAKLEVGEGPSTRSLPGSAALLPSSVSLPTRRGSIA